MRTVTQPRVETQIGADVCSMLWQYLTNVESATL